MALDKDEQITEEQNEDEIEGEKEEVKEEAIGLLPYQSPFLFDDLAIIPEDLQELETVITERSRK